MARSSQNFYDGGNERRNEFSSNNVYSPDTSRRQITNRFEDEKASAGGTYQARRVDLYGRQSSGDVQRRNRISVDSNRSQSYNQQTNPSEREQRSSKVYYTTDQNYNTTNQSYNTTNQRYNTTNQSDNKPRTLVLDINISIKAGRGNSQAIVRTNDITTRSQPINSRATIDNVRFLDIDFRSPERTAELATDGIIRDR